MIRIHFERFPEMNIARFTVADTEDGRTWEDVVRLDDWKWSGPPAREALSIYAFWLDLLMFVGKGKPRLECDDMDLLRGYAGSWRWHPRPDDWPFSDGMDRTGLGSKMTSENVKNTENDEKPAEELVKGLVEKLDSFARSQEVVEEAEELAHEYERITSTDGTERFSV
jgi:hypothetical protein